MEVGLLENELAAWDSYVLNHPGACNYHQSRWKSVIEQGFGHPSRYLHVTNAGRIVGILPLVLMKSLLFGRFLVSLPFFNYGGILADGQDAEEALLASAKEIARQERAHHIELRHRTSHELGLQSKQHKVSLTLDLESSVDSQWNGLNAKVRNQLRKAEKAGLCVQRGRSELLDDFYTVFARNMRDLGTPVYGMPFFQAILTNFPSSTRIFVVRLQDQPVAAGLVSTFKETVEMPWAASLLEHRNLCSNMLLYWEAIKFAIDQGFRRFDFGRSTPGEGTY
ncbi:MAG: FemAB family XrtA/PEP-CTERM system-associated protein, partial [Terriglobia bacterium]